MAAETLLDTLADTLEDAEAERPSHTQGNVEMKALIDTIADTEKRYNYSRNTR